MTVNFPAEVELHLNETVGNKQKASHRQCFLFLTFEDSNPKAAPIVSQHQQRGGQHGKEELVFRIVVVVF